MRIFQSAIMIYITSDAMIRVEQNSKDSMLHAIHPIGYSPFVYSDEYDIYMVSKKTNSTSYNGVEGKFLVFAHDKTYDYWCMTDFVYEVDKAITKETGFLTTYVTFSPWGYYSISAEDNGHRGSFQKFKVRNQMH